MHRRVCNKRFPEYKRTNKQTNKQASKQTSKQANKQTNKQANKQANKQTNKQTNNLASKQTNKQNKQNKQKQKLFDYEVSKLTPSESVLSFWVQNDRLQKVCFWVKDLSFRKKGFVLGRKRLFPVCNVFLCSSLRGKERLVSHGQTNSSYRVQTCVFFRPARLFSVFKFLPASLEASKGNGNSVGGCRRVLCRLAFENYLPD